MGFNFFNLIFNFFYVVNRLCINLFNSRQLCFWLNCRNIRCVFCKFNILGSFFYFFNNFIVNIQLIFDRTI